MSPNHASIGPRPTKGIQTGAVRHDPRGATSRPRRTLCCKSSENEHNRTVAHNHHVCKRHTYSTIIVILVPTCFVVLYIYNWVMNCIALSSPSSARLAFHRSIMEIHRAPWIYVVGLLVQLCMTQIRRRITLLRIESIPANQHGQRPYRRTHHLPPMKELLLVPPRNYFLPLWRTISIQYTDYLAERHLPVTSTTFSGFSSVQ